jgi:hypothetical protein
MNNIFQTSSLNIVAYLMARDIEYIDFKKIEGQTIFYYIRNENLQDILNEYNADMKLKKFISCFKKVKDVIKG